MKKTRLLFLALAILVGVQMLWWAYLVVDQQSQIASLTNMPEAFLKAKHYKTMIFSEAIFFLSVWTLLVYYTYRFLKKELSLQEDRRSFLSLITHELKTPLANIQLAIETMKRSDITKEQSIKYQDRALDASHKLTEQIDKILFFNELSNKNIKNTFSVNAVIHKTINSIQTNALIEFEEKNDLYINACQEEVEAIIANILQNAIKYSSNAEQPKVFISTRVSRKQVIISIKDNGIGLSGEDLKNVFQAFWRSKMAKDLALPGSGMGLTLSQKLCIKNKGHLSMNSSGINKGSVVEIYLPKAKERF